MSSEGAETDTTGSSSRMESGGTYELEADKETLLPTTVFAADPVVLHRPNKVKQVEEQELPGAPGTRGGSLVDGAPPGYTLVEQAAAACFYAASSLLVIFVNKVRERTAERCELVAVCRHIHCCCCCLVGVVPLSAVSHAIVICSLKHATSRNPGVQFAADAARSSMTEEMQRCRASRVCTSSTY